MAIYNELLSARFAKLTQKLFSMKGEQALKQLSGELMPVLAFFNGVENRFLESWQRYGAAFFVAGVAANISIIEFSNPAGSGVVAILERVTFQSSGASNTDNIYYGNTLPGLGGAGTVVGTTLNGLDNRGQPAPVCQFRTKNNTATGPNGQLIYGGNTAAAGNQDVIFTHNQELTVLPNSFYQFATNNVNTPIGVNLWWRERPLEESEQK